MRRFAACLALFAAAAAPAHAYTAIYSFGDSLSDVGNDYLATSGAEPSAPYFAGRFSNGPNWLDDLAAYYGVGPLLPSLAGGTDYAFGGARSGANTIVPLSGTAALVPSVDAQVASFVSTVGAAPSTALYTVWSGANDIIAAISAAAINPATNLTSAISQAVTDEVDAVEGLLADGATSLLVVGNPDLGATPSLLSTPLAGLGTALTEEFDTSLQTQISALPGVSYLNLFPLIADAPEYGFTNTTTACFVSPTGGYGDPNYLTDGSLCSLTQAGQDTHLFFDTLHPTEAGYAVVAELAVPEPRSLALLALGVAACLWVRRTRLLV